MTEPAIEPATDRPGAETPAADELTAKLAAAETRAAEARDRELRAAAELENVRKRAGREVEQAQRYAVERLVAELVPVMDSLELGLAAGSTAGDAAKLTEGMQMTLRQLVQTLERFGVVIEDPVGKSFDPERHEAIAAQPSAGHAAGTVLAVVQKGCLLNGRLVRPARVVVSRAPESVETAAGAPN